jgi:hypothetical protein
MTPCETRRKTTRQGQHRRWHHILTVIAPVGHRSMTDVVPQQPQRSTPPDDQDHPRVSRPWSKPGTNDRRLQCWRHELRLCGPVPDRCQFGTRAVTLRYHVGHRPPRTADIAARLEPPVPRCAGNARPDTPPTTHLMPQQQGLTGKEARLPARDAGLRSATDHGWCRRGKEIWRAGVPRGPVNRSSGCRHRLDGGLC